MRIESELESLLAIVDTGFNGNLMVTKIAAQLLAFDPPRAAVRVELGDGSTVDVTESAGILSWLNRSRPVRVLISDSWTARPDEPCCLIGTGLLTPHLLLVDFEQRTVEIESQS